MSDHTILTYIGTGRESAITRAELCRITGLPDRAVRRQIEQARLDGHIIINDGSGVGYYLSDDPEELAAQYRRNEGRARAILAQQKHLRRQLRRAEGHRAFSAFSALLRQKEAHHDR